MKPDCSFVLYFNRKVKQDVIKSLGGFCINANNYSSFDPTLVTESCSLTFIVDKEDALQKYTEGYEFSRRIENKILIGSIELWVKEEKKQIDRTNFADVVEFRFWPPSSTTNQASLDSKNLMSHFIKLLKDHHGIMAHIDKGDGSVEDFWFDELWQNKIY